MPTSTRKRLDGNLPQFLEDVGRTNIWDAMKKWKLPDTGSTYMAVRKIGIEATKNENFGLPSSANPYASEGIEGLLHQFIVQFANYIIRVDAENKLLRRRLEAHTAGTKEVERQLADEIMGLMEEIRG